MQNVIRNNVPKKPKKSIRASTIIVILVILHLVVSIAVSNHISNKYGEIRQLVRKDMNDIYEQGKREMDNRKNTNDLVSEEKVIAVINKYEDLIRETKTALASWKTAEYILSLPTGPFVNRLFSKTYNKEKITQYTASYIYIISYLLAGINSLIFGGVVYFIWRSRKSWARS